MYVIKINSVAWVLRIQHWYVPLLFYHQLVHNCNREEDQKTISFLQAVLKLMQQKRSCNLQLLSNIINNSLPAVGIIHPDVSSFKLLSINRTDHLRCCFTVNFNPAVHFTHINFTQRIFFQITHI